MPLCASGRSVDFDRRGIVASEYGGIVGVPALFAREVVRVPFPEGVVDLDTWQDYSGFSCLMNQEQSS